MVHLIDNKNEKGRMIRVAAATRRDRRNSRPQARSLSLIVASNLAVGDARSRPPFIRGRIEGEPSARETLVVSRVVAAGDAGKPAWLKIDTTKMQ